jgi:hypothetical protein
MAIHTIGTAGTYASYAAAITALTLPEAGGTIFEQNGTVTETIIFTASNFSNGLIVRAVSGEEADGLLGGATINGLVRNEISASTFDITNMNIKEYLSGPTGTGGGTFTNSDIGTGTAVDAATFITTETRSVSNCIIRDGSDDGIFLSGDNTNLTVDQCTIVDCTRFGLLRSVATDTLIIGSGTTDFHSSTLAASDYLASGDTSASAEAATTSFNNRTTADLNNYAGGDYNLAAGSSLNTAGSSGGRIGALLAAVASGPAITNVNTTNVVQVGDTPVVTGTSFLATGGTQSWGGVSVGVSSWADTSITSTAITRGDLAYNTDYDWIVTDNAAAASTAQSVQLAIETGYQVAVLSSPIITLVGGYRTSLCYGSVPDCVTGGQLRGPTTTDQGNTLTFNVDGTFSIAAAGNTEQTFSFEIWDANAATNDKWSASTAAVVNGVIVGGGGILRSVLKSPLKNILRNVLK